MAAPNGSSEIWYVPNNPSTEDDEFDDAAFTTSSWTENFTASVDPPSTINVTAVAPLGLPNREINGTTKPSWYRIQSFNNANAIHGIHKLFSGSGALPDGTYWTRVTYEYRKEGATKPLELDGDTRFSLLSSSVGEPVFDNSVTLSFHAPAVPAGSTKTRFLAKEDNVEQVEALGTDVEGIGVHNEYFMVIKSGSKYSGFIGNESGQWGFAQDYTFTGSSVIDRIFLSTTVTDVAHPGTMISSFDFFRFSASFNGVAYFP